MTKIANLIELTAVALIAAAVPAMASEPPTVPVPEPGTLSLLTVGVGGAWLVSKYLRRK